MKKIKIPLILLVIVLAFTCCNSSNKSKKNALEYVIGCSTPLTGSGANYGKSTKEGVELAIEEINNEKFLDKPLKVIFEDDKINATDGVNAINKLVNADKVPVIIGPFGSSVTFAVAPIVNKAKVVLIGASATADGIADAGDYVFRITPPNSKQGNDVASFCFNKLQSRKAAIVFQNNDYGTTLKNAFVLKYKELGGTITISEGVDLGIKDLKTQIVKIKATNPDIVFFPLHVAESGLFLKQSKEMGLNAKFISCDGAMVEDLINIAGEAAEGTFYTTLALGYGVSDNMINSFNSNFNKKYNKEPDVYAAYYYEVTKIIATVIKTNGFDAEKIKTGLYAMNGLNGYKGITGITTFDKDGEVNKSFYVYQAIKGEFKLYK